ncbi:hypothetical protein V6N11_034438 [Hibiscus sabdariffa]|uniref:Uncharacterized protein n=2 Tax=Hibiscus sabdariffa TaxID=183260 RepID=A0ABR2NMM0_9ROSI
MSIANSLRLDDGDNEPASWGYEKNDVATQEPQSLPPPRQMIQIEETERQQLDLFHFSISYKSLILPFFFSPFIQYHSLHLFDKVMEARALWMKEQQKQSKPETDWYRRNTAHIGGSSSGMHGDCIPFSSGYFAFETMPPRTYTSEPAHSITTTGYEEKRPGETTEMPFLDKSVTEAKQMSNTEDKDHLVVGPSLKIIILAFEDDEIDWPEDDDSEYGGYNGAAIRVEKEDVSFSDLEDVDDTITPTESKMVSKGFETF